MNEVLRLAIQLLEDIFLTALSDDCSANTVNKRSVL